MDCSSASQEMPQLQITDRAKHVWCWAFRGINSSPFPPSALTPVTAFITGRENIIKCPLTNTWSFLEEVELIFTRRKEENQMCLRPAASKCDKKEGSCLTRSSACLTLAAGSCPATHLTLQHTTLMEHKSCL